MVSMWESPVMPKNEHGGTDYDAKEGDVKLEPSLGNIKPNCCIESTHPSSPTFVWNLGLSLTPRWRRLQSGYVWACGNWVSLSSTMGKCTTRLTGRIPHILPLKIPMKEKRLWSRCMPFSMTVKLVAAGCMCFHLSKRKQPCNRQWEATGGWRSSGVVPLLDEWSSGVVHCFTVTWDMPLATEAGWFSVSLIPNLCFQHGSWDCVRRGPKQFCCNVGEFEGYVSGNFVAVLECNLRPAMFS